MARGERRCTVTVNESFVRDEVLMNPDLFDDEITPGALVAIDVVKPEADKQSQGISGKASSADHRKDGKPASHHSATDTQRRYIFVVKEMPKELKTRHPNVELYVAKHIADAFGMKRGSQVLLSLVCFQNFDSATDCH